MGTNGPGLGLGWDYSEENPGTWGVWSFGAIRPYGHPGGGVHRGDREGDRL